jgi:peptidyl-prolyl cis-trans isomerase C
MVTHLLREPLLHFLLAGALLFAADAALRENAAPPERVIRITAAEIDRLRAQWTRQYQRTPGPMELRGLVDARVREEVLYREALAMGLDEDDGIIRRRLAQKLEFLIEDLAAAREPTEAELRAYFAAWPERYRLPARVTFSHVYFSPDRGARRAEADASIVLTSLRPETLAAAAADRGDSFIMGASHREQSPQDLEAVFRARVRRSFARSRAGVWSKPIASAYGWHLVRIEARSDPRLLLRRPGFKT